MKNIDENLSDALYRSSPNTFIVFDTVKKEYIFSTGLLEETLGYSMKELNELATNEFRDLFHPEDYPQFQKTKDKMQKSALGEVVKSIARVKHANGQYRHFQLYDSVLERNEEGKPIKISSVGQDITSEVNASENLKKAVQKIEKIRFKNSHDLRAPVANILGILNLIDIESFQNQYQQDLFKCLTKTVRKLDDIIHQINEEASTLS